MNTSNKLNENKESQAKKPWKIKERIENIQTKARKGVTAALIGLSISWGFSSCENKGKEDPYKLEINEVPKALIGKKISGLCSYYVGWKKQSLYERPKIGIKTKQLKIFMKKNSLEKIWESMSSLSNIMIM